jgi:energy-coupling factor transport system substrate-specific component
MMKTKDITLIAILVAILFVQEQVMNVLPNISLTTLLIVLYTKLFPFKTTVFMIIVYVILDNLVWGSLSLLYTPSMLVGWLLIPILFNTVFKRMHKPLHLACFGLVFGFLYGWIMMPASLLLLEVEFIPYLLADLWFQVIMATFNFLTILWLYEPLYDRLNGIIHHNY